MSRHRYRTEVDLVISLEVVVEDAEGPEDAQRRARSGVMSDATPWATWPVLDAYARTEAFSTYRVDEEGLVS